MVALASPSEIKSKAIHQITHHTRLLPTPLFKPLFHAPTYKCTPSLAMSQHSPTHITFFLTFLLYSMCVDSSWVLLEFYFIWILFSILFGSSFASRSLNSYTNMWWIWKFKSKSKSKSKRMSQNPSSDNDIFQWNIVSSVMFFFAFFFLCNFALNNSRSVQVLKFSASDISTKSNKSPTYNKTNNC